MSAIVKRIDHLNIVVPDPRALVTFLADRLELPVAWPFSRFAGFECGGVSLGINYEPIRYAPSRKSPAALDSGAFALAFEPEPIALAAAELARRKIVHSPPMPFHGTYPVGAVTEFFPLQGPAGEKRDLWTVVIIGGLIGNRHVDRICARPPLRGGAWGSVPVGRLLGRMMASRRFGDRFVAAGSPEPFAFLCEYHGFGLAEGRARAAADLAGRGGGPLGALTTAEVVIEARDPGAEVGRWQLLLDPIQPVSEGLWQFGDGPALRVVEGPMNRIGALVWRVRSLDSAAAWLEREGLLSENGSGISIEPSAAQGVEIRLIDS